MSCNNLGLTVPFPHTQAILDVVSPSIEYGLFSQSFALLCLQVTPNLCKLFIGHLYCLLSCFLKSLVHFSIEEMVILLFLESTPCLYLLSYVATLFPVYCLCFAFCSFKTDIRLSLWSCFESPSISCDLYSQFLFCSQFLLNVFIMLPFIAKSLIHMKSFFFFVWNTR